MPSPFPGMNPYLEQSDAWMDFHDNFIVRIQNRWATRSDQIISSSSKFDWSSTNARLKSEVSLPRRCNWNCKCDYYVLVSCHDDRPKVGVWPFGLREPMPAIPVPLNAPDPPVWLDLKAVLDRTFDAGGYGKYIYEESPEPPLSEADMAWARGMIPKGCGLFRVPERALFEVSPRGLAGRLNLVL